MKTAGFKTTTVDFINRPNPDGTVTKKISVPGCLIAQNGTPTANRPEIIIHLPKKFNDSVEGAWVNIDGGSYHVIGTTVRLSEMDSNKPTDFGRYVVAEKIY